MPFHTQGGAQCLQPVGAHPHAPPNPLERAVGEAGGPPGMGHGQRVPEGEPLPRHAGHRQA